MHGQLIVLAASDPPVFPYLAGIAAGFVVGAFGHTIRSTFVILLGILIIGLTTALFIIATDPTLG